MSGLRPGDAVVVTGAAQGIGRAIALDLAARGTRLALWDVAEEACRDTAAECAGRGAEVTYRRVDVSEADQVRLAADAALDAFGAVFGLVNNAGIFPRAPILESTPEMWRSVLGVNLLGTVFCTQALGRAMAAEGRGAIVNIASGRALQGTPRGAHYAASKAGIVSFTKSTALEFAPHGIRAMPSFRASPKRPSRSPTRRWRSYARAARASPSAASASRRTWPAWWPFCSATLPAT
jgi:NAD(P)-dependent dehydrogenase (short-subunit alcohol dehydrogenase family)